MDLQDVQGYRETGLEDYRKSSLVQPTEAAASPGKRSFQTIFWLPTHGSNQIKAKYSLYKEITTREIYLCKLPTNL